MSGCVVVSGNKKTPRGTRGLRGGSPVALGDDDGAAHGDHAATTRRTRPVDLRIRPARYDDDGVCGSGAVLEQDVGHPDERVAVDPAVLAVDEADRGQRAGE